ncbi:MAG: helix-turn-helix domain-containing protein [Acidimicrobiales bacterium]
MPAARPAARLRPLIDAYIGYRLTGPAGVHRGLPARHLTCIVSIGAPIHVVGQTDPRQAPGRYEFALSGLQLSPAFIAHDGHQEGVAIELTPLAARALLGVPAVAVWNTSIEARDILGPAATELWERLNETPGWAARFRVCDEVLGRLVLEARDVNAQVRQAWRRLETSGGTASVAAVAADVGWSRRHLADRFTGEFGLSPKQAARVMRFERARRLLARPDRPALADVAATCGYYDQPHLNRDFVDLAGCPPGQWMAEELPSVQDLDRPESPVSAA